jgi:hypothetical protein
MKEHTYKETEFPKCPNWECEEVLENNSPASDYVIPATLMVWSEHQCGHCDCHYRARRHRDGTIEFDFLALEGDYNE